MGLKSLNCSFWRFFMGIDTKIRLNYPILHQHPTRQKPFILFVSVKKEFLPLN
ncbi:hypothetical protein HPELS_03450 [Helicobacter pylori ELS37]|uniref:Uncharacterized protein n=1 Tax=Helicobacter pylori ELS37 TaxID=1055527 RepID=A0ABC7ZFH9_HELPX|nr:hypothetical protein HPELS_03450 [Helicobacter pylori ELS37]